MLVNGAARPLPELEAILRSHPLVHAAEGELYRRVIARASEGCSLPTARIPAAELTTWVARATALSSKRVLSILAQIWKDSGRPWTKDQKEAALGAWGVLAQGGEGSSKVSP